MELIFRLIVRNFRAALDKSTLFFQFIFPVFWIYITGFAYSGLIPPFELNGKTISYLSYAGTAFVFMALNAGFSVGASLFWYDKTQGMFEQMLTGPVSRGKYLTSLVLTTILVTLLSSGVVLVVTLPILIDSWTKATPMGVTSSITAMLLATIFFTALGIAISGTVKSSETFQAFAGILFFVLVFPSSLFYPAETAPPIQRAIFYLNPTTHASDMFRSGILGTVGVLLPFEILALISESLAIFAIAIVVLRRLEV